MKGEETVGTHREYCKKRERTNTQGNGRWGVNGRGWGGGEFNKIVSNK